LPAALVEKLVRVRMRQMAEKRKAGPDGKPGSPRKTPSR
jgi:hypothetical protein